MNFRSVSCLRKALLKSKLRSLKKGINTVTALKPVLEMKEGQIIGGYQVERVCEVPELHLAAIRLQHLATGAQHLHIARNDSNNVFSVAFCTPPKDSTGTSHILEHIVLCGSKRYPVRDPFFKMLNRSLSTFMNAFTGNDYTMYPFSTQNEKDFKNLLQVYLDAVFFPNLTESDFRQEGWRLEHEDIQDKNSPIVLKGVVYNEMKGVFGDSRNLYAQRLETGLCPSHTYSHVSGGDPECIPDLTWDRLKHFHSTYYHPSNARFFTYGDIPLESHLESLEELALSKFSKISIDAKVADIEKWTQPKRLQIYCQTDPMVPHPHKQTILSVSYLLNKITDTYETFTLSILSKLLTDGPNSSFYQALIESGIGTDYSPSTGYNAQTKQSYYTIGLQGVSKDDEKKIIQIIEETIEKAAREGFPQERIEGILHNIELSVKHQTSNFGLALTVCVNEAWNHCGDPIDSLLINKHVEWFKQQLKNNPRFLQDKIIQYFKDNRHRLTLVMNPKDDYEEEKQITEKKLVQNKLNNFSVEDKEKIYHQGIQLAEKQSRTEDISCLPTLKISDVDKNLKPEPVELIAVDKIPVQICEQPTNGIVYFHSVANTANLPNDLKPLLPLFCFVVTKMGAGNRNYREFDQQVELKTGGLNASVHISENPENIETFEQGILFGSHCLDHNVSDMFHLWADVFNEIHLEDKERLFQLVQIYAAELAQQVVSQGHLYSLRQASSFLSESALLKEQMFGLSQIKQMKKVAEMKELEDVIKQLRQIAEFVLHKNHLRCSLNCAPATVQHAVKKLENSFLATLCDSNKREPSSEAPKFTPARKKSHFIMPSSVNYIGKSISTVPYCHKEFSSLRVASNLLTSKFLHPEIRERGGAYGGGCFITHGGMFNFYSYRDPNTIQTLSAFQQAIPWFLEGNFTDQDIEEAKLRTFGEVDMPVAPGDRGMLLFLKGISDTMRQELRKWLFAIERKDLYDAVSRHLSEDRICGISVIGPKNDMTDQKEDWVVQSEL